MSRSERKLVQTPSSYRNRNRSKKCQKTWRECGENRVLTLTLRVRQIKNYFMPSIITSALSVTEKKNEITLTLRQTKNYHAQKIPRENISMREKIARLTDRRYVQHPKLFSATKFLSSPNFCLSLWICIVWIRRMAERKGGSAWRNGSASDF